MRLGIVGLPNVGKSTLFNAITKAGAESANYPFCTIEPNVGVVSVPDKRLDVLEKMYGTKRKVYTAVEFYDIAGLVKGASKGEGLGNKFLSHIREVEAIVHAVRCFEDENVVHVEGSVDPIRDIETINLELIFADLEVLERRMEKGVKLARSGDKKAKAEYEIMEKVKAHLEANRPIRTLELNEDEEAFSSSSNPDNSSSSLAHTTTTPEFSFAAYSLTILTYLFSRFPLIISSSDILQEYNTGLDEEEKAEMLEEYGIEESGLDKLIRESYKLLGLISYLTAGVQEVRAWTIKEGTKAPAAAGKIHSDIERGFIRAEVVSYDDLVECGSEAAAKEKGLYRLEGKEYVMKDGDVVNFRFNV